ncbi:hypothetical protein LUZ61_018780 [Rhynchospora tenuis]|uniref:peroxidase n=1 Tax=Rhynchospora tenuis TaxID=198213 RepID=A0AAD5ZA17_9POAL|nr:hypothetical protein LUZ61_018780 [Rhynchospora tenuis]
MHVSSKFTVGCDASVLLKASTTNPSPENNPIFNLRGFELIDAAKAAVEAICPRVVSCADILAFAARDAIHLLTPGGCIYDVPSGRCDGTVSSFQEALVNLPPPTFNLTQLKRMFESKNLSFDELITLSGAHSIGQVHCSSFTSRLYPYNPTHLDSGFAHALQRECPKNAAVDCLVPQDHVTPDALDVQYYTNVLNNQVLFFSDYSLSTDPVAKATMQLYSTDFRNVRWRPKFIAAMQKLGQFKVLTGTQGQIRKTCAAVN